MDIIRLIDTFWEKLQAGAFQEWGVWNYVLLSLLVAVEGPIATLLGAAAASAGFMRLGLVWVAAAAGNLAADAGWYMLGRVSNEGWLLRYFRWLGLRRRHLERLQQGMHLHSRKILLVAKLSTGFVIPALIAAGLSKVPFRRWFSVVFLGEMLWTTLLVLVGYFATEAIKQVEKGLHYLALAGMILIFGMILYLTRRKLRPTRAGLEGRKGEAEESAVEPAAMQHHAAARPGPDNGRAAPGGKPLSGLNGVSQASPASSQHPEPNTHPNDG